MEAPHKQVVVKERALPYAIRNSRSERVSEIARLRLHRRLSATKRWRRERTRNTRAKRREISRAFARIQRITTQLLPRGAVLLAGDFNAEPRSEPFRIASQTKSNNALE